MTKLKQLSASTAGAALIVLGVAATTHAATLAPTADSYIRANNASTNFGTANPLLVKNDTINTGDYDRKAYLRFI